MKGVSIWIYPFLLACNMHKCTYNNHYAQYPIRPYALTKEDVDAQGEQRFISLGMGAKNRILLVVWTLRGDVIRLISAWKATQPQRKRYEQQF